jgi:hypothetical protein
MVRAEKPRHKRRLIARVIGATAVKASADDVLAPLANTKGTLDTEFLTRDDSGAFGIKNTTTSPAVMLSSKRTERSLTEKALFDSVIFHPELLV